MRFLHVGLWRHVILIQRDDGRRLNKSKADGDGPPRKLGRQGVSRRATSVVAALHSIAKTEEANLQPSDCVAGDFRLVTFS